MSATSLHRSTSPPLPPVVTAPARPVLELVLSGDVDMQDAEDLRRYLTGGVERGCDIVIDLADVRLIDCVCLDVLVRAARAAHALDSTLSLVAPSELVRTTLHLTDTEHLFRIFADPAAAAQPLGSRDGDF
jgi:anti-anti-sigma factor